MLQLEMPPNLSPCTEPSATSGRRGRCSPIWGTPSCRPTSTPPGPIWSSRSTSPALNDRYAIVYGLFNLGLAEYLSGSSSAAESLFAESLALARRVAIKSSTAYAYIGLALTTTDRSDIARSARLHGAADAALAALGETVEPLEARLAESDRQRLRTVMGDEEFEREYTVGQGLAPEDASALALSG